MPYQARVEPIDRDIELLIKESFSPQARVKMHADYAREQLAVAQDTNRKALGRVPPHQTFVDGAATDRLESVRPDGVIAFEFSLIGDAIRWVAEQLELHSPKKSGLYSRSHVFLADGVEVALDAIPLDAKELAFVNSVPYARKIERGLSNQAPDGVYEVVAVLASQRFGNVARFRFGYRTLAGSAKDQSTRQPAITVTV